MKTPETVTLAAIRICGQTFTDNNHGFCYNAARDAGIDVDEHFAEMESGFVTSTGRFISRRAAFRIARKSQQAFERVKYDATQGALAEQFNDFVS